MSNNFFDSILITDNEGKQPMSTVFGELTVGERRDDISVQFQYSLSAFDLEDPAGTLTGTGSVTHVTNKASINSGTGVGSAKLVSRDSVRYRPGHECLTMFTADFTTGESDTFQHIGLFNGNDGYYFGYKNDVFGVFRLNGGSEDFIPQSTWNKDKLDGTGDSEFTLDPTKYNIYKISFGWLGVAPIYFSVYGGHENGWIFCHVIDLTNTQSEPHIENPSLPITMETGRTSGTGSDMVLLTSSIRAGVIGEASEDNNSDRRFGAFNANVAVAATTITHILSLKSKATYQSKDNHVKVSIEIIVATNSAIKDVVFKAYAPSQVTLSTPLIYNDVNTAESVIQESKTAATITELSPPLDIAVVLSNSFRANTATKGFNMYAGNEIIFAIDMPAGAGGDISLQLNWVEGF